MDQVTNSAMLLIALMSFCEICCFNCGEIQDNKNQYCLEDSVCKIQGVKSEWILIGGSHERADLPRSIGNRESYRDSVEAFSKGTGGEFGSVKHYLTKEISQEFSARFVNDNRRAAEFVNPSKSDAEILFQFKNQIIDPSGALGDWKMGRTVCNWTGVLCQNNSERVIFLNLTAKNLEGRISPALGELQRLSVLDLSYNQFSGGIPASLGNCFSLRVLLLQANRLNGTIPPQLGLLSNLTIMNAESNLLNGNSSLETLSNCFSLRQLYIGHNHLTGVMPRSIEKLSLLTILSIHHNQFSGILPSQVGHLTGLQSFSLNNNLFVGSIPRSIGYLQNLQTLNFDHNLLSGALPFTIFRCRNLMELKLGNNMLNGQISSSIEHLQQLTILQLQSNRLTGGIPSTLGNCLKLQNVNLSNNYFKGLIPASISKDDNLTSIDFSFNNLSGEIPPSLANLSKVSFLNFSENNLTGQIPDSGIFLSLTPASFLGNPLLCGRILRRPNCQSAASPPSPAKSPSPRGKHHHVLLIALVSAFGSSAVLIFASICWYYRRVLKSRAKRKILAEEVTFFQRMSKATSEVVESATRNYDASNLVGVGPNGSVFMGLLSDGTIISVKVLDLNKSVDDLTFFKECQMLRKLRHKNIVSIYSVLSDSKTKALVLPFLFGGSLHKRLHDPERQRYLSWETRLKIIIDVADALHYLHVARNEALVHAGLRPSNILLNDENVAQVSDYGMYLLLKKNALAGSESPADIREYEAPEYTKHRKYTVAGDIYSFGVVLLETVTGRNPAMDVYSNGSLRRWVKIALHEKSMMDVIDKVLLESENCSVDIPVMAGVLKLAVQCTEPAPQNRPTIKDVLSLLMQLQTYKMIRVRSSSRAIFPLSSPDSPRSYTPRRFVSHSL